jgi:hypothetical protein
LHDFFFKFLISPYPEAITADIDVMDKQLCIQIESYQALLTMNANIIEFFSSLASPLQTAQPYIYHTAQKETRSAWFH